MTSLERKLWGTFSKLSPDKKSQKDGLSANNLKGPYKVR